MPYNALLTGPIRLLPLLTLLASNALGQGTILWDESINGFISQDFSNPTSLGSLQSGTNSVLGSSEQQSDGGAGTIGYYDYFTFVVPASENVVGIVFNVDKPNVWVWVGNTSFSSQLWFLSNPISGDLLPQFGITSIGPNTYGMYVENHDSQTIPSIANYRLDFVVVPEPGTISIFLTAAASLLTLRPWKNSIRVN